MFGMSSSALGGFGLDTAASAWAQRDTQQFNEKMYRNRYQWTVEDLKKAGLNPILAAQGGLTGSAASASPASMARSSANVSSAAQAKRTQHEVDLIDANRDSAIAQRDKLRQEILESQSRTINNSLTAIQQRSQVPGWLTDMAYLISPEGQKTRRMEMQYGNRSMTSAQSVRGAATEIEQSIRQKAPQISEWFKNLFAPAKPGRVTPRLKNPFYRGK